MEYAAPGLYRIARASRAARQKSHCSTPGCNADDVVTFAGAEEGVFLAMHALLGADDHAVVVWPAYQSLHEVARSIGASVTLVPLDPRDWSLDVDAVAAAMRPNTKVIVVNFPHSPTGAHLEPEQFARLVAIAELHGARLFSDEVYRLLEHSSPRLAAAAESSPRGVSLGVMSKAFGLAGLRVGWIATRDRALRARIAALKDYTTICIAAPSEILALIALGARDCDARRANALRSSRGEPRRCSTDSFRDSTRPSSSPGFARGPAALAFLRFSIETSTTSPRVSWSVRAY